MDKLKTFDDLIFRPIVNSIPTCYAKLTFNNGFGIYLRHSFGKEYFERYDDFLCVITRNGSANLSNPINNPHDGNNKYKKTSVTKSEINEIMKILQELPKNYNHYL